MNKIFNLLIISSCASSLVDATKNKELYDWYEKITDQKFNCPAPIKSESNIVSDQPIIKIVDCDDPLANFRYDYKVSV